MKATGVVLVTESAKLLSAIMFPLIGPGKVVLNTKCGILEHLKQTNMNALKYGGSRGHFIILWWKIIFSIFHYIS